MPINVKRMTVSAVRAQFADSINRVCIGRETIIITRKGKPIAAMVPAECLPWLEHQGPKS